MCAVWLKTKNCIVSAVWFYVGLKLLSRDYFPNNIGNFVISNETEFQDIFILNYS